MMDDKEYFDLWFPARGLADTFSENEMPPGFTTEGINVRFAECLTGRERGGSRPGIEKWIDEQHSGDNKIQHLNTIVTTSGAALGWSVSGVDQGFPGVFGGLGFLVQISGGEFSGAFGDGGGGYQPNNNVIYRKLVMSSDRRDWPAGSDPTNVYVTVRGIVSAGGTEDYIPFENEILQTKPDGAPLDETQAATDFDLDDPPTGTRGVATFAVFSLTPRTVYYTARTEAVAGRTFFSRNRARIRFTPYKLTFVASSPTAPADGTNVTLTGTLLNHEAVAVAGATIALFTSPAGRTGNGATAVTNGSGQVVFTVFSFITEIVTYFMTEQGSPTEALEPQSVTYGTGAKFRQAQSGQSTGYFSDGITASFSTAIATGSLVVVAIAWDGLASDATPAISSVVDDLGNTYVLANSTRFNDPDGRGWAGWVYYKANATGGSGIVTVTGSPAGQLGMVKLVEYGNIATTSPLHNSAISSGYDLSPTTGIVTINAVNDLIFAMQFGNGNNDTVTTSGFTDRTPGAAGDAIEIADRENATANSPCEWSLTYPGGFNPAWVCVGCCFKQA